MKGVASAAAAGQGGSEIKDSFQALVLEVDAGFAPEGRVRCKVEFKGAVKVGGVEM